MSTDITTDSTSRFTIFVPKPLTRINMGKPDMDTPFGYKGLSMQTDATMFADVNKMMFFQSWKDACFQAVGKWVQWADAGLWMSSATNTTVTSGAKMLVVAGAGQMHDMLIDHGMEHVTPRLPEYNNLELHYRIEEIHNGLKKFFYGKDWKTHEKAKQGDIAVDFGNQANPVAGVTDQQLDFDNAANYNDGFLKKLHTFLGEIGYDDDRKNKWSVLQPLEWEGDYIDMTMGRSSVYSALRTFDPYPAQGFSGTWTRAYAVFVQVVNWLKRTVDVIKRLASGITENALGKRVQALFTAWNNAQDGINNILNSADIARFDRSTEDDDAYGAGGAFGDEARTFGKRLPSWTSASAATSAELSSLAGPFDISGTSAANAYIDVRDVKNGTQTRIWFSEFLAPQKATISLTTIGDFTAVAVSVSGVAAPTLANPTVTAMFTLAGTAVTYTRTAVIDTSTTPNTITGINNAWGSLPTGFQMSSAGVVSKTDGSPFSVSTANGITFTDQSFGSSDTMTVTIDGTAYTVPLSSLNASSGSTTVANDRASALATAINGQHSGAASASSAVVTIQSDKSGATAQVAASAIQATTAKLTGATSALALSQSGKDTGVLVRDLAAKLGGAGKNFAVSSGATVKLTHNATGKTSYIEIAGPLATTFFGANPATATGTDRKDVTDWNHLTDMRNLQFEVAKWPEDVRHLLRPVTDSLNDVVGGLSKATKDVFDNMMTAIIGVQPKTMALGLIAKDGITLGTSKAIWGTGQSITFVAAPPSDPDDDKFVPGAEKLANWVLTLGDVWTKAQWDKFKPAKKKPGAEPKGDFRVAAAQDIIHTAGQNIRHVALGTSWFEGNLVTVQAKTKTHITSRIGQVHVQAASVVIGDVIQDAGEAKQLPTNAVVIQCQNTFDVYTTSLRMQFDETGSKIRLGKRVPPPPPPMLPTDAVDATKPHLLVDLSNGAEKAELGFTDAGNMFGVSVAHDGQVSVNAKTTLTLSVKDGAAVTVGAADVSIAKKFKVGTALLVQGDGVFMKAPVMTMVQANTRPAQITAAYAQTLVAAGVQLAIITACDLAMNAAIAAANVDVMGLALILAYAGARMAYDEQVAPRQAAVLQLGVIQGQRQLLIDEARLYDMDDAALGRAEPANGNLFVVPPVPARP